MNETVDCPRCRGKSVVDTQKLAEMEAAFKASQDAKAVKLQKAKIRQVYLRNYHSERRQMIKDGTWVFRKDKLDLQDLYDLLEAHDKGEGQSELKHEDGGETT